ncbi:MAG: TonB family protein, partial [Pseudomonadota bacterium]
EARRQAAKQAEAARQEAVRQEAARLQEAREEDARREARRRAMGRILEEEAARREAAQAERSLPWHTPLRRARLWGRTDPNGELIRYAEAWERKIQLNTPVERVRELAARPHGKALVTVALRSDGTIESVTLVTSSGVPEVDAEIQRIIHGTTPYPPFPPALANQYDVVEIRRTWSFDTAVRLY